MVLEHPVFVLVLVLGDVGLGICLGIAGLGLEFDGLGLDQVGLETISVLIHQQILINEVISNCSKYYLLRSYLCLLLALRLVSKAIAHLCAKERW